jgi:hypothetical protein
MMESAAKRRPLGLRALPFDQGIRAGFRVYLARLVKILTLIGVIVALAALYAAARHFAGELPRWTVIAPVVLALVAQWLTNRWSSHGDFPPFLDQLAAIILLIVCLPAIISVRLLILIRADNFPALELIGRKGRVLRVRELGTVRARSFGFDVGRLGVYRPDPVTMAFLIPHMVLGRVRFRGRPLLRVERFMDAGPVTIEEFGRAPGLIPADTGQRDDMSISQIGRLTDVWRLVRRKRHISPGDMALLVLVRRVGTPTEQVGGPLGRIVGHAGVSRVVLPFIVSPGEEHGLREELHRLLGADDVLIARAEHLDALLHAAWIAWGKGIEGPPAEFNDPEPRRPTPQRYRRHPA